MTQEENQEETKTFEKYFEAITRISLVTPMGNPIKSDCVWGANRLFVGGSGVGKTERTEQEAERHGLECHSVLLSQHPPEDFSGVPITSETDETGLVIRCIIGAIRRLNKIKKGVLHLDEIGNASKSTQGAALALLNDRKCGDTDLSPKIRILLSTNPPKQTSTGSNLLASFANRSGHWMIGPDYQSWRRHIEDDGIDIIVDKSAEDLEAIVRKEWPKHWADMRALLLDFMDANQGSFYQQPKPHEKKAGKAWPSPRTWKIAHRCVAATRCLGMPAELEDIMVEGWVGEGPSIKWVTFKSKRDIPSAEKVLLDWNTPNAWKIDNDRQDRTLTVAKSVQMFVLGLDKGDEQIKFAKKAWGFLADLMAEGQIDCAQPVGKKLANNGLGRGIDAELDKMVAPVMNRIGKIKGALKYSADL